MADTVEETEAVTESDVREAERAALEAERLATAAREALANGDSSLTIDDLEAKEKQSRFAQLFAKGRRNKADLYAAAQRSMQIRALRDEVIATAPKSGDELVTALKAVEDAAREFIRLADEHDARLRDWVVRAQAFHIPAGTTEHGVGLNGISHLVVNDLVFETVNGPLRIGGVFQNQQSGYPVPIPVRAADDEALAATYRLLDRIGEGL